MERELVTRYDRRPGQREDRYGHLLGGEAPAAPDTPYAPPPPPVTPPGDDRLAQLEREVAELRAEVAALREAVSGSGGTSTAAG
jgi:uncharacterized protein